MLKEQRKDLNSDTAPPSPTTKGFMDENDKLQVGLGKHKETFFSGRVSLFLFSKFRAWNFGFFKRNRKFLNSDFARIKKFLNFEIWNL